MTLATPVWALAALGSGLVAGVFLGFSTFVMDGLRRLPPAGGVAAMQAINVAAVRPPFMVAFLGSTVACLAAAALAVAGWGDRGASLALAGAVLHLAGSFGVTVAFNVPLNDRLAAVRAGTSEADVLWARYLRTWVAWNHVRTAASAAAAVLLAAAAAAS